MSLIADGLLIATSLTTALYCVVLSRRLRRLSDTDEGIGQQVLRLNAALSETRAAVGEIRASSRAASDQLEQDIEAAKRQSQQLQLQIARALKSGVAGADGRTAPAPAPMTETEAEPENVLADETAAPPDDAAERPAARVIDFEGGEPVEDELDEDLRAADAAAGDGEDLYGEHGPSADDPDDDLAPPDGDAAEDADRQAFGDDDPGGDDDERTAVGGVGSGEDPAEQVRPRGRRSGHRAAGDDADKGLLRVERMAV